MGRLNALGALILVGIGGGTVQLYGQVQQLQQLQQQQRGADPAAASSPQHVEPHALVLTSPTSRPPAPMPPAPAPLLPMPPAPTPLTTHQQKLETTLDSVPAQQFGTAHSGAASDFYSAHVRALWPPNPRQPAPWAPCYCLEEGGQPTTLRQYSTLSKSQKFDDSYIRGAQRPLGPRTPWVRCSRSAGCLAKPEASPARERSGACKDFRIRMREPSAATARAGAVITLEVSGRTTSGEECRPQGDYFQVWLSGPDGLSVSATAVPPLPPAAAAASQSRPEPDGVFAVRLMHPGTWAAYGMWMLDGDSKEIVLFSSKVGLWYGPGVPNDSYGKAKGAWEGQARRDSLGTAKDTTLVAWQDKQLLKQPSGELLKLKVEEEQEVAGAGIRTASAGQRLAPCVLEQFYEASSSGAISEKTWNWSPNACALPAVTDGTNSIAQDARIMLIGDATTLRAFELLKQSVGDCRAVLVMKSQAEKYPNAEVGVAAGSGQHYKCARGVQLWFHGFANVEERAASSGYDKGRRVDQFDFAYLGATVLDLVILGLGKDFLYYDQDKWSRMLDEFLPAIKTNVPAAREFWFMSQNRFCGPCVSNGKGYTKGNKPVYLRELQNQARADGMTEVAMAKAEQHGWRPLNQYAISSAIPVMKQDNGWGLKAGQYMYVVQHIAHYLPLTMRGGG